MSATSGGGGSVSEGSDAGGSSQSTASVSDSPSTSFQTNLMSENVTKITLSEENSAGGYVADMTGSKINLALDERQQKDGIVNVAFDYEESANRGSSGGGEFRSANGSEKRDKVPEAVNLELVNMVPYSNGNGTSYGMPVNGIPGIPMKKDSEQVDMSTPYDEYFVPVNEHKKYMRGEKLYVTKDKRRPTSWRRCLSWIIACTVISVVLIIAILAGTGVILSQEPDLVKDASVGRNFAGSNLKPSVTDKSSAPTAEKLMFVPRSIESEFVIDNLDFDPALRDLNSTAYQQFTSSMEDQLKMLLFDKETLEFGASDIGIKVVNISRDPFKVNYRIGWNYKQGVNNPPEPIKMEDVKRRLVESLARNQGYIDKYHIDREAIKVNHVIDACQMENGGCSHICYYNYLTQLFTCTCPTHLVLDSTGKNCVAWSGSSEDDAVPIPSHVTYPGMPYDSTSNPVQELESTSNFQLGAHQNVHYHQESNSEQSKDSVYEGNGDQQDQDHDRATKPKSKPTSDPYSNQEGKSRVNSEDMSEPTPEPNVKEKQHEGFEHDIRFDNKNSQYEHGGKTFHSSSETSDSANASDSSAESTLEGKYQDHAHSVYESKKPVLESASESAGSKNNDFVVHSSHDSKDHEPAAEPSPEYNPERGVYNRVFDSMYDSKNHEPAAEPSPEPAPEPTAELNAKDKVYTGHPMDEFKDHEPAAEPTPAPEPTAELNAKDKIYTGHPMDEFKDHEPAAEPTPALEPNAKDKVYTGHSIDEFKDHEPAAEPTPAPEPNANDKVYTAHHMDNFKDHEPAAEPTPEPTPEPTAELNAKDKVHVGHAMDEFKDHEPAAEPTPAPEPTAELNAKDKIYTGHPMDEFKDHEPAAEPTPAPEPTAELNAKDKVHVGHSVDEFKDHEPAAEPTPAPEPTAELNAKDKIYTGHPMDEFKDHEPAAEPTPAPEPTAELNAKDKVHVGHAMDEFKDHEPAAEPTPEPTSEPSTELISKSHDSDQVLHSLYNTKNNEPAAEPTPEVNSGSTVHDHVLVSAYDSRNHQTAGEHTPEPTQEFAPELARGSTAELDHKDKDHALHSAFESKDREPERESASGFGHKDHGDYSFKHDESLAKPTTELNIKDQEKVYGTHFMHETKDLGETTTLYTLTDGNHAAERAPKPTSEPSDRDDHLTRSSNTESSEHVGTTIHVLPSQDNIKLGPNYSLNISKHLPVSHEEHMQVANFKPGYSEGTYPDGQSESDKGSKSGHQVPYLQDIIARVPYSDSGSKNATTHGQKVLQNVEFSENGEPIIEEILIDKSREKGQDETSSPTMISNSHSDLNRSSPVIDKNSPDLKSVVLDSSNNNYQNKSVFIISQSDDTSETKTVPHEITENATGGPVSVDRSTVQQSTIDGNGAKNGQFEYTQIPTRNRESEETSNNQKPTKDFTEGANNFGGTPLNPTKGTDQEEKAVNLPRDKAPDSTVQPQLHDEYHTIPVAIEFSNSPESNINISGKPKHDSSVESDEPHSTMKVNAGLGEESTESVLNSNGDLIFGGVGSDETKSQKITTESHIATTMLFSVLSPDAIERGKTDVLLNNETGEGTVSNETVLHTKTGNKQSSPNSNETIKSPEELTNNIKDELIDNEEFNTLLGKEQKKEIGSGDGKELVNKYANKSQKVDKKKLKDYVKNEKIDSDKKTEVTARPAVTPEDFILQKHVNGNENIFDLDYSLQNEHTTKQDGGVTVIDPNEFDAVPGVSFKPQGINNHDLRVLQTVAPDSTLETGQTHDLETLKSDSKVKLPDNKEGDKQEKDYTKFDKDYKYEKQKVSKKKDLKKKGGNGKDGKNVEIDDGRKYFTETSKENVETSHEIFKDNPEIMSSFEKITVQPEPGVRLISDSVHETATTSEHTGKIETPFQPSYTNTLEKRTEVAENVTEYTGQTKSITDEIGSIEFGKSAVQFQGSEQPGTSMDQNYHQMINDSSVKTTFSTSPGIIYDGQSRASVNSTESGTTDFSGPLTETENIGLIGGKSKMTFKTVLDGIPEDTGRQSSDSGPGFKTNGTMVYETRYSTSAIPKVEMNEGRVSNTTTTANPTIIIHGQSGSLQDGHFLRFANATSQNPGNTTVISILNGALNHSDGQVFTFKNYTTTFPNGSIVKPTIIVRGQSGALQGGHEVRFGNGTTFVTSLGNGQQGFKNSTVFRIENGSLPGTVFDGHFNPLNGHYHMFSNSSGTFVYSNVTAQPTFIIKGESGDFGNSRVYVMANDSGNAFSGGFTGPSVIFRNSTVFAVGNAAEGGSQRVGIQEITTQPHDVNLNETIHYTRQMSPNFFSTGTAYKVNNYFGYISKCAAGQFQCVNGTSKRGSACISLSSKCDSISDCSDGSDELGCIENGCPGNFQCSDGSCLKRHLVCNGILDCSDGSDEKQCESWKCEFDEFQCPSGRCIPVVWQCDGKPDCDNHTDEYNCQTSCGNDEYLCPEGWCVPLTYKCNGVKECSMGEDEQLCDCSHEEFKCQTGGCVSMKQICDGLDDCPDRSDEWDCVKVEKDSNLLKIRFGSGDFEPVCADGWTHRNSEEVCTSLGYYSSVPMENENSSSITTEKSFFILKNDSTDNFNKRVIVNLKKSEGNCSSGRLVAISCQEFSCGSRSMTDSSSVEARLVGGMSATAGQWPSVALLYNVRNFHSCTANVLTPRWALASYNCLKMGNKNLNEQDWKFFGGSTVFEAERENAETRKIVSIIPHPQVKFNQFLFSNDLALVELDQSLQFNSNLGAVCLPEQEIQPRQICVTAGWGMNTPEDKFIRQQLQYLPVPTMNLTECNSTEHYSGFITDDKICAGYNSAQKSLCYNEEGAPLMCVNERGEWELQGVMSYHSNCGRGSHPSIFSSITPVADWIKKTIGNNFERKAVTVARR